MTEKTIGQKIKSLRESKKFSRENLARLIGTTSNNIYQLESGRRNISLSWLMKISKALEYDPGFLINEDYKLTQPPTTPHLSLVSDNPYPIIEKYLRYSMDIYDQVIGSNLHFEEEKAAILYEVYKIVYDFFEKEHHPENEINKIDLKAKAMTGVFELLKRKGKT